MISVDDIALLFRGDDCSLGYASQELIVELCSRTSKFETPTVEWCLRLIYAELKYDDAVKDVVVQGVKLWYRRGRPRHS